MRFLLTFVCCTFVVAAREDEVVQFEIQDGDSTFVSRLLPHAPERPSPSLKKYSYTNCGDPDKELLVLNHLTFGPDPLSFPGPLTVAFDGQIKGDVNAPLKATVSLQRKVGSAWIKIPCVGSIGSCTYDDLCEKLENVQCPPPFVAAGIPCKCPFSKGTYKLPTASFDVEAAVFPSGDYHAVANVTYNSNFVACVELYATFD